jgi:hypothetical protein
MRVRQEVSDAPEAVVPAPLLHVFFTSLSGYATVLGFGPLGDCCNQIPDGYGGFHWDPNFYNVNNGYLQTNYGFSYGAPSGGAAFNAFDGRQVSLWRDTPFTFEGAYFSTWGNDDQYSNMSSLTVTILAYDSQNQLLGTIESSLPADQFIFVGADIPNVSKLVFDNDGISGHRWLMDDLTYEAVPEPASLIISGSGISALFFVARSRFLAR